MNFFLINILLDLLSAVHIQNKKIKSEVKMKKIFFSCIATLILVTINENVLAVNPNKIDTLLLKESDAGNYRIIFIGFGIGYLNILNARFGLQISEEYSFSLTANAYAPKEDGISPALVGYGTLGIRLTKHMKNNFSFLNLNSINLEVGYSNTSGDKTGAFELTVSKEDSKRKFITPYYTLGFAILSNTTSGTRISPSLKLGLYLNF